MAESLRDSDSRLEETRPCERRWCATGFASVDMGKARGTQES